MRTVIRLVHWLERRADEIGHWKKERLSEARWARVQVPHESWG